MGNVLSKDWAQIFSHELGGIVVQIHEDGRNGSRTWVDDKRGDTPMAHIEISNAMKGQIGKIAALRHEHGHLELDSFSLKDPELTGLGQETMNVIEDVRINLQEAERFQGFRDGFKQMEGIIKDPTAKLLWNATQNEPANIDERYIFALARNVNDAVGGHRHENRDDEFYSEYRKFARAVVRYVGKQPEMPQGPGGMPGDGPVSDSPGNDGDGSGGEDKDDKQQGSGGGGGKEPESKLKKKEDKPLTGKEQQEANHASLAATPETTQMFAQHSDLAQPGGNSQGFGGLMDANTNQPKVENEIQRIVKERFKKIKITGRAHDEAGIRMNVRVASRGMFTGETKFFKVPAKKDIRNAKFVILQDISGSMGCQDIRLGGRLRSRAEMAYHFGKAMETYMTENGAHVESYRFNDNPFAKGLSLQCTGGTNWSAENTKTLLGWVKEGFQVIILTDGGIGFDDEEAVRELFARADKRPVGMNFVGEYEYDYGGGLDSVYPDWKKFKVGSDPIPAIDLMVKEFAKRYRWQ